MEVLGGVLSILFVMLAFILVLVGTYFATKYVARGYSAKSTGSGNIKILERVPVGQDKQLLIVSVAGKTMLMSVTPGHLVRICDLDENLLLEPASQENSDFSGVLKNAIKMGMDKYGRKKGDDNDRR